METTFMTILSGFHAYDDPYLTPNANILYVSDSIVDILGYQPQDIVGRSCFDYFHPEELPLAKSEFNRGVQLDKAAVLQYARIRAQNGEWIYCECVFTVVYNVVVACTSIYTQDEKSEKRKADAPVIRRMFASSPRDPRYHMLQHLSVKFKASSELSLREPRAALILNRFTRTLTVMYSTDAVTSILGVTPEILNGKSFYECIQENCLPDAIRCLESAKANDSIAYLRFWYRDPRRPEELGEAERETSNSSDSDEEGGVQLTDHMDIDAQSSSNSGQAALSNQSTDSGVGSGSRTSGTSDAIFDQPGGAPTRSTSSSVSAARSNRSRGRSSRSSATPAAPFEIEAVVSCTSDGLVLILRRARPLIPQFQPLSQPANGVFAAPWGANPIMPPYLGAEHDFVPAQPQALDAPVMNNFINSIREVAVFAWGVTGINGNLAEFGKGNPAGESAPPNGFPVWDPKAQDNAQPPENQAWEKWKMLHQPPSRVADNGLSQQYARHQNYVHQQMGYGSGYMGTDVPGSGARNHLGPYIEDGRGPGIFQDPQRQEEGQNGERKSKSPSSSDSQGHGASSGSSSDRYLWY